MGAPSRACHDVIQCLVEDGRKWWRIDHVDMSLAVVTVFEPSE
jgi:hypothetical protein